MKIGLGHVAPLVAGAVLLAALPGAAAAGPASPSLDLDDAVSAPRTDSVYPAVGHREVDALSYDLDLAWNRHSRTLTGRETLVFRATTDAPRVALDFAPPLTATKVTVGGRRVPFTHRGKDLVIGQRIAEDRRYTLRIEYGGRPRSVPWPTERSDGTQAGWLVDESGQVVTFQEPYGAYTWYPVNDHPSDKALYDVRITAPRDWTGVSNGELVSRHEDADGRTVTHWRMDKPEASYLVLVAIGDYTESTDVSASGVPLTYWTPAGSESALAKVRETTSALDWLESRLGPYPFHTLGVVVASGFRSAMETQSTITLGTTDNTLSKATIVHELAHQWYGDLVTPTDWSDFWMNEGMATHIEDAWVAEDGGRALFGVVSEHEYDEEYYRQEYGPPARYRPGAFGMSNVYYGAELMWDDVLRHVGWQRYWTLVRKWPQAHPYGNATYDQIVGWWSRRTGLSPSFFDRWLRGLNTPQRIALSFPAAAGGHRSTATPLASRTVPAVEHRQGGTVPFPEIRAALVEVADRLDEYADRHGAYPDFDEGTRFATQVVGDAGAAYAYYVPNEARTSYCLVPQHYYEDLDFAYDSGAHAVVDAPAHDFPADSVCARLWPVLERTIALQHRAQDLQQLVDYADNAPADLSGMLAAQDTDLGYLFPPPGSGFVIGDYAWPVAYDQEHRFCVLDEGGGAVSFTTREPIEPPYLPERTFPYGTECVYAE